MNGNEYLTINQIAKACSISRASILRMEKEGILTPAYINPDNGYRYYDHGNVLRILRNSALQDLGITRKELKEYYDSPENYQLLLGKLQSKLTAMENYITFLNLQLHREKHLGLSSYYFREIYCYTETLKEVRDHSTIFPNIWNIFSEAILRGYSIDRNVSPFVVTNYKAIITSDYENLSFDYKICIPIIPQKTLPECEHFPAVDTISTVLYGGENDIIQAFTKLSDEIKRTGVTADDNVRVMATMNSYPGEMIPKNYWALRVCIPIIDQQ